MNNYINIFSVMVDVVVSKSERSSFIPLPFKYMPVLSGAPRRGFNIEYDDDAIGNINSNSNRKLGVNAFASLRGAPTSSNW